MRAWFVVGLVLVGCDGADEVTCELEVNGVTVCVDQNDTKYCEKELGGVATNAELEPGGPYAYCEDVYAVACDGASVIEKGDNFTAEYPFYANSEEDCAAADGGTIGG
jgi:hypothetical protein